jgi:integrase/recombinase XerC/integrase/recombinase XerD
MTNDLIEDFLRTLRRKGRSANTLDAYRWALGDWIRFLQLRHVDEPSLWTRQIVEFWQDSLETRLKPKSRSLAATALRVFLAWCGERGKVQPDLHRFVDQVSVPKRIPRPLPAEDLGRLKEYFRVCPPRTDLVSRRDRALFLFLVGTCARVSEVLSLDREDLLEDGTARVVEKGGHDHILVTPRFAVIAVRDYLSARTDVHPALWVTHDERLVRKLTSANVRHIWHRVAEHLGLSSWTTHQLRHTGATELLNAGVPLEVIAAQLGHHGLASVQIYAQLRMSRRREAADVLDSSFDVQPEKTVVFRKPPGARARPKKRSH